MYLLSHAHTKIVVNDHTFVGYAKEDPPYDFEVDGDLIETTIGPDGGVYGLALANFGGSLMVKLAPTSLSTQWCIQQRTLWQNDLENGSRHRIYNGTIQYMSQGSTWALRNGVIVNPDPIFYPNATYEMSFQFGRIIPNVDGGRFLLPSAA